jgi:hypothetical protein
MPHDVPAGIAFQIVLVLNCSTASQVLSTRPSDVPHSENARLGFVWVGTEECHASLTAYALANPLRIGSCVGVYASMIWSSSSQLS